MSLETWLAYAGTCLVLISFPGPMNLLIMNFAIQFGKRRAATVIPGAVFGDFIAISISLSGVGLLLAASPGFFVVIKIAGALALIALGTHSILRASSPPIQSNMDTKHQVFWSGFALALPHPGGFVFFTSFVPQFLAIDRPFVPQAIIFMLTFVFLAAATSVIWLIVSDQIRKLVRSQQTLTRFKMASGALVASLGIVSLYLTLAALKGSV